MEIDVRRAVVADVPELVRLYRLLEGEMVALKKIWRLTEGLPEPLEAGIGDALTESASLAFIGTFCGVPAGFLLGRTEPLLPQAGSEQMAAIRFIFTEPEFRELGVGEAMMDRFVGECRAAGLRYFDAHVSPGHRLAKNFFESHGFKARHIVMHRGAES